MLHLVNKSPFERNTLDACLKRAVPGSAVLLFEDAVYAAVGGTAVSELLAGAVNALDVFVLQPDLAVRGLDPAQVIQGVKTVDYDGFVDLTVERGAVQSWL
jgi:tRNA 2-thiouridine synthesizing protein B